MKYFSKEEIYYTAAGIVTITALLILSAIFSMWGWFGFALNILMLVGAGAILGEFFHTWHIDYKFEKQLDNFEEEIIDALRIKKTDKSNTP